MMRTSRSDSNSIPTTRTLATYCRQGALPCHCEASLLRHAEALPFRHPRARSLHSSSSFLNQAPDDGAEEVEAGLLADVESPQPKPAFPYDNVPSNNRYTDVTSGTRASRDGHCRDLGRNPMHCLLPKTFCMDPIDHMAIY
ncbi:hypothetical protein DL766_007589 [Monosporascus sp. MC13-8B]|uniref:Uncharacterized protein n=1 Tax=Monosporascus cannonballus TaxID=155416 RepID=A0ABY0HEC6_9PEZI|nr:hypothetical protein DL763_011575 [Monosporascus cannonballus]RYO91534.1 hypothetical protein DL762_002148 [Monosporascus cannonballus]RYP22969.1 hypothetical protein DL766_007589 [Monosporascus sp. MC13-8B]